MKQTIRIASVVLVIVTFLISQEFVLAFISNNSPPPPPPSAPRFPNIGFIAVGYNIYYGNPYSSNDLDPGFGGDDIFTLTYNLHETTADGLWSIPDSVSISGTADACSLIEIGQIYLTIQDYAQQLQTECTANFTNFAAAFSANEDFKDVLQNINEKTVVISTKGVCEAYRANVNRYVHPELSSNFVQDGSKLPTVYNVSTASQFWSFFNTYGTHYFLEIAFGGRLGYVFEVTQDQWTALLKTGINIAEAASYDALYVLSGVQTNLTQRVNAAQQFNSYVSDYYEFSLGPSPPSGGSLNNWEIQTIHSNAIGPMTYSLDTIDKLFGGAFTTNQDLQNRQSAVSQALADYCSQYLGPANITTIPC